LINKSDDGWWVGEKDGVVGHFPSMLVEELVDRDSAAEIAGNLIFSILSFD